MDLVLMVLSDMHQTNLMTTPDMLKLKLNYTTVHPCLNVTTSRLMMRRPRHKNETSKT